MTVAIRAGMACITRDSLGPRSRYDILSRPSWRELRIDGVTLVASGRQVDLDRSITTTLRRIGAPSRPARGTHIVSDEDPSSEPLVHRMQPHAWMTFEIAATLAHDDGFDARLPIPLQSKSWLHFTPIAVARQAARLLAPEPGMTILDVGSGAGKFCLAAADELPDAHFTGVEVRSHLVRLACEFACELELSNVNFIHADAFSLDWARYDAFYLYNPFAEQRFKGAGAIDRTLALDPLNFLSYVTAVHKRLSQARLGTRVVTYHGCGGPMPRYYDRVSVGRATFQRLELWVKTRSSGHGDSCTKESG